MSKRKPAEDIVAAYDAGQRDFGENYVQEFEATKSGMDADLLEPVLEAVNAARNLRLSGLMTMPPWTEDPELSRPYFRMLRGLAESHGIAGLSMGMSRDLEVAIQEGATHVRIGTAIFGERAPRGG